MAELASAIVKKLFDEVISFGIESLLRRRLEVAREIFLSQLESGDCLLSDVAEVDEAAAAIFEYLSAAQRGAARANLRLMAQVFSGQIKTPPLYADEFLRWAGLIASLSREEIIALTVHTKMWKRHKREREAGHDDAGKDTREVKELIDRGVFRDGREFARVLSALTRTGLVIARSGWGNLIYEPTDLAESFLNLVDTDAALREPRR